MDNDLSPQNKRWVLYENGLFVIHNNYLIGQKLQKETLKFHWWILPSNNLTIRKKYIIV